MIDYYPSYTFFKENIDIYFPNKESKILNIYVDVKNGSRSVFYDDYIQEIYNYMLEKGGFDITTFFSLFAYTIRIRKFFLSLGFKDVNLIYFLDFGKSIYHHFLLKSYKKSRLISSYKLDKNILDSFFSCLNKNYIIAEKVLNLLPNVYFILLENLESDFIPHYLIKNYYNTEDYYHLIFSTDKDMLQTLKINDYIYQFVKVSKKDQRLVSGDYILKYITKINDNELINLSDYFLVYMSLVGDSGDDVPGVKGIGPKKAIDIIKYFYNNNITPEIFEQTIYKQEKFNLPDDIKIRKLLSLINNNLEILSISYRLISFDSLIDFLNIKTGLINDNYNFNYGLNMELKRTILEKIDNYINREKNMITYSEIIDLLTAISKNACCKVPQFTYEELQEYFPGHNL